MPILIAIRDTKDVPVGAILDLYREADWACDRSAEEVRVALERTQLLLTVWDDERCVAMLRAFTDGIFRALVDDVIVLSSYRGRGLGRRLLEAALTHPLLRDVEEVVLFTGIPEFYEKYGFVRASSGMVLQRKR